MPRSVSATASTTTWRTPSAASLSSASRKDARTGLHLLQRDQPDLVRGLARQHAHQAGVGHRVQRMMAHAGVRQQHIAHEQVAEEDGAAVLRERRAIDRLFRPQRFEQRVAHRADIAGVGRIEGRAIFEEEAHAARPLQGLEGGERLGDGFLGGDRARLQRHDHRVHIVGNRAFGRHANGLDRAHAAFDQHARDIGRAGEVVGDHSENSHGGTLGDHRRLHPELSAAGAPARLILAVVVVQRRCGIERIANIERIDIDDADRA